ncbi:MAG: hypothetical protein ABI537_05155, partial [Casimicrobiaceae bacterium]
MEARGPEEFDGAFAAMARERAEALIVAGGSTFLVHRAKLAELAMTHKLPMLSNRESVEGGGLMAYAVNMGDFVWCRRLPTPGSAVILWVISPEHATIRVRGVSASRALAMLISRSHFMKKFLVQYLAPASVIDDWKKTDPAKRKDAEDKMMAEWKKWMSDHAKMISDRGAGVGKTKKVGANGVSDSRN